MAILSKHNLLYERDESGRLKPVTATVSKLGGDIRFIPLTKAEVDDVLRRINNKENQTEVEKEILRKHLIEPQLSDSDLAVMKWKPISLISGHILTYSLDQTPEGEETNHPLGNEKNEGNS